jgi:hypothetical protein
MHCRGIVPAATRIHKDDGRVEHEACPSKLLNMDRPEQSVTTEPLSSHAPFVAAEHRKGALEMCLQARIRG